jgi:hypothetical protein
MTQQNYSTSPETGTTAVSIPRLRSLLNGRVVTPDDARYAGWSSP